MLRPKIGLDWDDVTAPFNSIAVAMANEKYHIDPPLRLEEIDTWENRGRAGVIKEFYEDEELYARQQVPEKNKKAVHRLMEIADVYFITAVAPAFMRIRAKQILTAFPEFPPENIILGNAKNLVQFDIILDDAIHNVLETPATYPVLMRKPWNWKMTGLLSVNQMSEFVSLVRQIIHASQTRTMEIKNPSVLALVGPSGSGKDALTKTLCQDHRFVNPKTYCTKKSSKHHYLTKEQFAQQDFFERTLYMRSLLNERNIKMRPSNGDRIPIIPIYTYEPIPTLTIAKELYERGVYVNSSLPPAAAPHECLLRTSLMATHTHALIDEAVAIIADVLRGYDL